MPRFLALWHPASAMPNPVAAVAWAGHREGFAVLDFITRELGSRGLGALVAFMLPSSAAMKIIAHGTAAYGRVTRLSCVIREV